MSNGNEIIIPISGGNYTYIIDNIGKRHIETIELKYDILQKQYKNKNKLLLNNRDKTFYINYLFTIFDYLTYCKCPMEKGIYTDLTTLIKHLEECYDNINFEYNKNQLIKQLKFDILLKNGLLHLLKQLDDTNKCNKNSSLLEIKVRLINHLKNIKNKEIKTDISGLLPPSYIIYEKKILKLHKKHKLKKIQNINLDNKDIIINLDKLIIYLIELNKIYKNYIIELEKYNIHIVNELYKLNIKT